MALQIGGGLNFGGGYGALAMQNPQAAYQLSYADALNAQKQNYSNILSGYQATMAHQQAQQQGVTQGFNQLNTDVQNTLQGANASNLQAIKDSYAQQSGAANQSLATRGLGNTTVVDSIQRGLGYDYNKAVTGSNNAFANTRANYMSNIGMAGLNYQGQAARDTMGLAGRQLDWMNSVNIGYPDVNQYNQLAKDRGMQRAGLPGVQMPQGGFLPNVGGWGQPGGRPGRRPEPDVNGPRRPGPIPFQPERVFGGPIILGDDPAGTSFGGGGTTQYPTQGISVRGTPYSSAQLPSGFGGGVGGFVNPYASVPPLALNTGSWDQGINPYTGQPFAVPANPYAAAQPQQMGNPYLGAY